MQELDITILGLIEKSSIACLFALENESDNRVALYHTNSLLHALERIITNIRGNKELYEDYCNGKLKIKILEETRVDQRLKLNYWYLKYKEHWKFYNTVIVAKYQVVLDIEPFSSQGFDYRALVRVRSKNRRTNKVVGVFNKVDEAKDFIANYYSSGSIVTLKYCDNEETRKYLEKLKQEEKIKKEKIRALHES